MIAFTDLENFGLNKTVGYAYDISNVAKLLCLSSLICSFIAYLILAIFKYRTSRIISSIYIVTIFLAVTADNFFFYPTVVFSLAWLSIIVSILNIIAAIKFGKYSTSP
jgi:hypothetical protein